MTSTFQNKVKLAGVLVSITKDSYKPVNLANILQTSLRKVSINAAKENIKLDWQRADFRFIKKDSEGFDLFNIIVPSVDSMIG